MSALWQVATTLELCENYAGCCKSSFSKSLGELDKNRAFHPRFLMMTDARCRRFAFSPLYGLNWVSSYLQALPQLTLVKIIGWARQKARLDPDFS